MSAEVPRFVDVAAGIPAPATSGADVSVEVNGETLDDTVAPGGTAVVSVRDAGSAEIGTVDTSSGVVTVALSDVAAPPGVTWVDLTTATIGKVNSITGTVTYSSATDVNTIPINGTDTGGALLYGTAPDRFVFPLLDQFGNTVRVGREWPCVRVYLEETTRPTDPDVEVSIAAGVADSSNTNKMLCGAKYDGNIGLIVLGPGASSTSGADGNTKRIDGVIAFAPLRWGHALAEGYNSVGTTKTVGPTTRANSADGLAEDLKFVVEIGHRVSKPTRAADTMGYRIGYIVEFAPTITGRVHA